jgi:hypothetical protein
MIPRPAWKAWIVLLLAVLACGFPAPSGAPTAPPPTGAVQPTPTAEPDPLPVSMSQAVSAGARAGLWTEAEGLIRVLRYLVGELSADEVFGDQVLMSKEGSRVVRRAQIYLEDPTHADGREEMTRLLRILVPSRETLDRFSRPASASRGGPGLARPVGRIIGDRVLCQTLWSTGFEYPADEPAPICLEVVEIGVGGLAHRIYYPEFWAEPTDGSPDEYAEYRALVEPTRQALERSLETYNAYGPNPVVGTDIVFTDLPALVGTVEREDVQAAADRILRSERCHVAVFPSGTYVALRPEGNGLEVFQQIIAHELFHCYQMTNLAAQESGPARGDGLEGDANDWWVEGSAEYFGSVVYPSVNAEFGYIDELDSISPASSLIFYAYPAFAFFQYLDVQAGMSPQSLIDDILRQMPTSGGYDDQQAAVAGLPGMADAFHEFGQSYLDKQLQDLGGGTLPLHPQAGEAPSFGVGPGEAHFRLDPLVLHRYRLAFADHARFTVALAAEGVNRNAARPASAPGAWSEMPPEVNTDCGDSEYVLLATSVVPPGADEVRIDLTTQGRQLEEDQPCDECVVGTWTLDNSSYLAHMGGLWPVVLGGLGDFGLSTEGIETHPTDAFGVMTMTFDGEGIAKGEQSDWGIAGVAIKDGKVLHSQMVYNGAGEAAWRIETDETTDTDYLFFSDGSFALIGEMTFMTIPLRAIPFGESNDSVFLSSPQPFLCSATTLTYYSEDPLGPVVFIRSAEESLAP